MFAAIVTLGYAENSIQYLEKMVCVIEDYQDGLSTGLWEQRNLVCEGRKFNAPIFSTIGQSVKINPEWIRHEIRSQQINSQIAIQTQRDGWAHRQGKSPNTGRGQIPKSTTTCTWTLPGRKITPAHLPAKPSGEPTSGITVGKTGRAMWFIPITKIIVQTTMWT